MLLYFTLIDFATKAKFIIFFCASFPGVSIGVEGGVFFSILKLFLLLLFFLHLYFPPADGSADKCQPSPPKWEQWGLAMRVRGWAH